MTVEFDLNCKPMGKIRPRFGKGHTYNDERNSIYETLVKRAYIESGGIKFDGEVSVMIEAYFQIPKSMSKKDRILVDEDQKKPLVKPDIDNIIKIILDGLNGAAYDDDKQVTCVGGTKRYAFRPKIHVIVNGEQKMLD